MMIGGIGVWSEGSLDTRQGEDRRIQKRIKEGVKCNYLFRGQKVELRGFPLSE